MVGTIPKNMVSRFITRTVVSLGQLVIGALHQMGLDKLV